MMLLAALLAPLNAAPPLATPASDSGSRFGRAVFALGDLDGDGVRDFAVGAPTAVALEGRVVVLSGADRSPLQVWEGERGRPTFGHRLRDAGDVDGDGARDVLVGYEFGARTEVRSGQDGRLITAFDRSDAEVHPLGDLDEDGRDELLITAGPHWEVRSGHDGRLMAGPGAFLEGGQFHPVGDVDGDGLADGVLIGKTDAYLCRMTREAGTEFILHSVVPYQGQVPLSKIWPGALRKVDDLLPIRAAAAGDLDGDGTSDLLVTFATPPVDENDFVKSVHLVALSLSEPHRALWTLGRGVSLEASRQDGAGYAVATDADLDGDGLDDLVIAESMRFFKVGVSAWAARANCCLWKRETPHVGALTGASLAPLEDQDGDGVVDILVGTSDWHWHGPIRRGGTVALLSGKSGTEVWSVNEGELWALLGISEPSKSTMPR